MYLKAKTRKMLIGSTMLAIRGSPADHDTQICNLNPMLIWINIFHGWYDVAILDVGVDKYIYAPVTDVTRYSSWEKDDSVGHDKKKKN